MGTACCCLRDEYDFGNRNSSIYRNCICLHCLIQNFVHVYASLFHGGEERALPSPTRGTSSLTSTASTDNSLVDLYRSPPRSLPYDADMRYFHLPLEGLVSRREKGSSHANEETELLRPHELHEESESVSAKGKWSDFTCDEGLEEYNSKLMLKLWTAEPTMGFAHIYATSEDEDVCPKCLEEYTTENPKIITKCSCFTCNCCVFIIVLIRVLYYFC
ncbi:E3 ubiquitin-protein ligase at3g02290 [Phtheirospermum japonicum]|uniref:RING-type E3 ubiquitin transferase n=1 Tax=Phtheirospermum japonicum TaxID=374723 RepID=A0A830BT03_9LAMI|nr:E3 ubiquitin-protein ligase at3g02290 [Phtheirospermum japonicum]